MEGMLIKRYCTCGAVLKVDARPYRRERILSNWYAEHSGTGHKDCSAADAEAARMGTGEGMGRESQKKGAKHARS